MDCLFVCLFVFCAGSGLVMVQNLHVKGPKNTKFDILIAVVMKIHVMWVVMPCAVVSDY